MRVCPTESAQALHVKSCGVFAWSAKKRWLDIFGLQVFLHLVAVKVERLTYKDNRCNIIVNMSVGSRT